jgi:hypothetical protein
LRKPLSHSMATITLATCSHLVPSDMYAPLAKMNQIMTGAEGKLVLIQNHRS